MGLVNEQGARALDDPPEPGPAQARVESAGSELALGGDGWLAGDDPSPGDDTGIDIGPLASRAAAGGRGRRVRIGPLAISANVLAWMISVSVHGAVIAAACLAVHFYLPRGGRQAWGGGSGAGESAGGIVAGADSTDAMDRADAIHQNLSAMRIAEPNPGPASAQWTDGSRATEARWNDQAGPASFELSARPEIIGVQGIRVDRASSRGAAIDGPAPARRQSAESKELSGNGSAKSIEQSRQHSSGKSPAAKGEAGRTTGPGLPGDLLRGGLPKPNYPTEAQDRGEHGTIVVEIEILPTGKLGAIHVIGGPNFPLLRQSALAAAGRLRAYQFTPAFRFGRPVRSVQPISYQFILK